MSPQEEAVAFVREIAKNPEGLPLEGWSENAQALVTRLDGESENGQAT